MISYPHDRNFSTSQLSENGFCQYGMPPPPNPYGELSPEELFHLDKNKDNLSEEQLKELIYNEIEW